MSKRLRTILAGLLALTLLVASLPLAALSETTPVESVEAPVEETSAEATEAPAEEPAAETPTEEAAAEEAHAEEAAEEAEAEATEVPVEEPVAETPTEEAATAEATEAPAEEVETPTEEPEAEATEAPVEEPVMEEVETPVEEGNESFETSGELSDAQKEALENLPTGFSSATVALAMLRSSGCEHTYLYVWENCDSQQYTVLNDEKHNYTYRVKSRKLQCDDCGEILQEITVNETISKEECHDWVNVDGTAVVECMDCGASRKLKNPCSHKNEYFVGEDGNLQCWVCGASVVLNPEQTYCKHTNYTEYGSKDNPLVEYKAFSKEQHVKIVETLIFSDGYGFAICDDCGEWLELENGKVISVGITDYPAEDAEWESILEAHTFENGVCKFCGEKGETAPETCDHSAGNFRDELDESVAPKYLNITETTHCVQYSYKRYCKDCDAYIKNVVDEGIAPVEHDFSKGDTCPCGYQKQEEKICDHSAGNFRDELDESVAPEYFSISATTHRVRHSYKRYCKDCGAYIKIVKDEGIAPVEHDFSKGDTCPCGYSKQEEKPYVTRFTMSEASITVGDTVKFTLELANVEDGEALEVQFLADDQLIKTFSLTAPQNTFEHKFSQAGDRKLQFRVTGGECCPAQTLKVESDVPKVENVSVNLGTGKDFKITETAEGTMITATLSCNSKTGLAELYVGENYASSESYTEENGQRIFTITLRLGGEGASYAGKYEICANALKQRYVEDAMDKNSVGTLTVGHDFSGVEASVVGSGWDSDAKGHKHWQKLQRICAVCGKTSTETVYEAKQEHSFDAEDKCSKCGYNLHINKANTVIYGNVVQGAWGEENRGTIRAMTQGNWGGSLISKNTYSSVYWGKLDGSDKCNRAAASMALSYIGIDALPKDFSDGSKYIEGADSVEGVNSFMKDRGVSVTTKNKVGLTLEGFKELFDRYNNDSSYTYSPVMIYTNYLSYLTDDNEETYTRQSAHWLVVYAQDPDNSDYYLVLDSGGGNYAHVKFAEENGKLIIAEYQYRNSEGKWTTSDQYGTKVGKEDAYKMDKKTKEIYNTGTKVKYNMNKILQYSR